MKNRLLIITVMIISLAIVSCGSKEQKAVEEAEVVAEKFEKALFTANFESAKEICTEAGKSRVESFSALFGEKAEKMKRSNPSIERQMYETDTEGGRSTVEFMVTNCINPSTGEADSHSLFTTVKLLRNTDGYWMVDSF